MSYYKNSIDYHQALDNFEARARAEQAERDYNNDYNKLQEIEQTYGKDWEKMADDLHYVLANGNEMIETQEIAADFADWGQQVTELRGGL